MTRAARLGSACDSLFNPVCDPLGVPHPPFLMDDAVSRCSRYTTHPSARRCALQSFLLERSPLPRQLRRHCSLHLPCASATVEWMSSRSIKAAIRSSFSSMPCSCARGSAAEWVPPGSLHRGGGRYLNHILTTILVGFRLARIITAPMPYSSTSPASCVSRC